MRISIDVVLTKDVLGSPSILNAAYGALGKLVCLAGLQFDVISVEQSNSPAKTPVNIAIHPTYDAPRAHTLTLSGSGVDVLELVDRFIHTASYTLRTHADEPVV